MAGDLRNRLAELCKQELPSNLVLNHPTARQISKLINGELPPEPVQAPAKPPEKRSYDCVIAGGGICACAFARDMASMGHSSLIIEAEADIGGTWRRHDYPGLKLHLTGEQYRCLSLPPPWTLTHKAEDYYQPTRHEIYDYVKEMAKHPLITVMRGTKYLSESELTADSTRTVQTSGVHGEIE
eukprot:6709536-Prymnesium_polylepis.3